jgi:hypothetical protein
MNRSPNILSLLRLGGSFFKFLSFTALLFILAAPAFSQESEAESSYRLDESGRILQRISWSRSNAYYYEVEIERQIAAGEWRLVEKQKTEELFVEVSLAPGMYRYRIVSYNVLGRAAAASEWAGIRVFATRDPKIERIIPEAWYVEEAADVFTLVLEGLNLMEGAEVYIAAQKEGAGRIQPESIRYSEDEKSITLVLRTANLDLGLHDIVVVNPGKLQAVYEGFALMFRRALDVNVSLGYAPFIPFYGYIFDSFSSPVYPAGFYARVNAVFFKRLWGFAGAEFTPRLAVMETPEAAYTVHGTMMSFAFDGLYQYWFSRRTMVLNFRLGGGFTAISGIYYDHADGSSSEPVGALLPLMNAGLSFEWVFWRDLFAEAGLDYTQYFSSRGPAPGALTFTAGMGWRF